MVHPCAMISHQPPYSICSSSVLTPAQLSTGYSLKISNHSCQYAPPCLDSGIQKPPANQSPSLSPHFTHTSSSSSLPLSQSPVSLFQSPFIPPFFSQSQPCDPVPIYFITNHTPTILCIPIPTEFLCKYGPAYFTTVLAI